MYRPEENAFYIVLPSNVENLEGSSIKNEPAYYRTNLDRPLQVDKASNWEVALIAINFMQNFNTTITLKNCLYQFQKRSIGKNFMDWLTARYDFLRQNPSKITARHQLNQTRHLLEFLKELNRKYDNCTPQNKNDEEKEFSQISKLCQHLNLNKPPGMDGEFSYDNEDGHVTVKLGLHETLHLSPTFASILGFSEVKIRGGDGVKIEAGKMGESEDEEVDEDVGVDNEEEDPDNATVRIVDFKPHWLDYDEKKMHDELKFLYKLFRKQRGKKYLPAKSYTVRANFQPDIRFTTYNLFVYSNLVSETLVGNVFVKILRTIPIDKNNDGKYIGMSFDRLRFRPLSSNFFKFIDVQLTNDMGETLNFKSGKSIVTLYVRRRNTATAREEDN